MKYYYNKKTNKWRNTLQQGFIEKGELKLVPPII